MSNDEIREHLSAATRARLDEREARIRAQEARDAYERDVRVVETLKATALIAFGLAGLFWYLS